MKVSPVIFASLLFAACASEPPPEFDEDAWLAGVKASDISKLYAPHYNEAGKTFFNPWMPRSEQREAGGGRRSWFFNRKKAEYPAWPEERYTWAENSYSYLANPDFDSISFAGHASVIIKLDGETVFADPFFSDRAAIASKEIKLGFDYSKTPEKPLVLLSHNHYDHLDKQSVKKLIKKNAVFIVPLKLKSYIEGWGAKEVYELDWWESLTLGSLKFTFLPAQHWSMRAALGQGNSKSLWGGWLVEGSKTIYFSGDTGYFRGFEEFGSRYKIDYALIGAGAYDPRWFMHYQHLNAKEFVRAASELNAKVSIPMHFGAISLSDEPLNYPLFEIEKLMEEFAETGSPRPEDIRLLRVGEYLKI